jgi:hypothetical protein
MNSSPQQPEDKKEKQEDIEAALERRRQQLLEMETTSVAATPSWGERLLPFLFAAMETCWIDAILIGLASFKVFQAGEPLMPLWAPFVFIAGSLWLARYLERRDASVTSGTSGTSGTSASDESKDASTTSGSSGTSLIVALVGLVTLFIIWLQIYAQTAFVFDPTWILAMLNDILLLNVHAYQIFATVGLAVYLCWRGIRLSRRELEPAHAFSTLRIGLVVIIAVILVRTGQEHAGTVFHDEVLLFLLIPIFVFLSLFAHALARAAFVRREHPVGLQGSIVAQERSITLVLGGISLILLLVVLSVASMASPAFFTDAQHALAPVGTAYEWLVGGLARVLAFLFTPIFWLLEAIHFRTPQIRRLTPRTKPGQPNRPTTSSSDTAATIAVLVPILKILLPILLMLLAIMIIRLALRRRRIRVLSAKRSEDLHESLWSWTLFWTQLKAFFRSLFGRFLPRKEGGSEEQIALAAIQGGPAVRTIREVYRALLKRAASLGYARKKDETPYEFQQRLDEKVPMAEPHLAMITEAYTATRYGDVVPDEADVVRVRNSWIELEEKLGEHSARGSRGS